MMGCHASKAQPGGFGANCGSYETSHSQENTTFGSHNIGARHVSVSFKSLSAPCYSLFSFNKASTLSNNVVGDEL